ncbi:MAG: pseudouridine synthase, partial [Kangiellaceae bacterium]
MPLKVTSPPISFDNIELIFEHPDFVIVNKPKDISFHTEKVWPGFFEIVKASLKMPLWPVHRLDKLTSGIIIFAKSQKAAEQFRQIFENKKIEKTYIALSDKK